MHEINIRGGIKLKESGEESMRGFGERKEKGETL